MTTQAELHALIDKVPACGWPAAAEYLAALVQAKGDAYYARLLLAPEDDEPSTPEEDAIAEAAWQEYLRGESISAEELKEKYGLR